LQSGQYVTATGWPATNVVDDLVPDKDLQRIGADLVAERDDRDRLALAQPAGGVGGGLELRAIDRRDAVLRRPP
jgi:hypothetical protein